MEYVNISQAIYELHIYPKKFKQFCETLHIIPQHLTGNKRDLYITTKDLATLRKAVEEWRKPHAATQDEEVRRLRTELEQVRAELARALEVKKSQPRDTDNLHYTRDTVGYVYLRVYAEAHNIPRRTAENHVEKGFVHETLSPVPGKDGEYYHLLSLEQQQEAIAYWRQRERFKECDDPSCCCHLSLPKNGVLH